MRLDDHPGMGGDGGGETGEVEVVNRDIRQRFRRPARHATVFHRDVAHRDPQPIAGQLEDGLLAHPVEEIGCSGICGHGTVEGFEVDTDRRGADGDQGCTRGMGDADVRTFNAWPPVRTAASFARPVERDLSLRYAEPGPEREPRERRTHQEVLGGSA